MHVEHVASTSDPERKSPTQPESDTVIVKCHLQSEEEKNHPDDNLDPAHWGWGRWAGVGDSRRQARTGSAGLRAALRASLVAPGLPGEGEGGLWASEDTADTTQPCLLSGVESCCALTDIPTEHVLARCS